VVGIVGTRAPTRSDVAPATMRPVPATAVALAGPVFHVDAPSGPGAVITTPGLVVRGTRAVEAGPLRVTLESSGGKLVASQTLADATGSGPFRVDFPLSNPRPGGTMVVQVVAFTSHGIPVEVVRIPIEIGAVLPGTPGNVGRTREGTRGEDGIIGGIVFGSAWDPEALEAPATP